MEPQETTLERPAPRAAAERARRLKLAALVGRPAVDGLTAPTEALRRHAERRPLRALLFEGRGWTALRLLLDAVLLACANVAAVLGAPAAAPRDGELLVWLMPPLVIGLLGAWRMYRDSFQLRIVDGLAQVVAATSLAAIGLIAAAALLEPSAEPAPLVARAWLFATAYLVGGRLLLSWAQRRARQSRLIVRPTLIVGAGKVGAHVERRLAEQPALGMAAVGYLDPDPPPADMVPERHAPLLGTPDDLARVVDRTGVSTVVLSFSTAPDAALLPFVRECERLGLKVLLVPRLFESVNVHVALDHLGGLPLFGLHSIDPKGWQFAIKHVLDRLGALAALTLFGPLMIGLAAAIKISSPGPILFTQERVGRDGRPFRMLKFRSMRLPDAEAPASPPPLAAIGAGDTAPGGIEGADRRTRVGALMRGSSLDELPQLINVLRGEMSLVGPRPERPEFVDLFGARVYRYDDRLRVKAGITGCAQLSGLRGKSSLRDRIELDNFYIENWSLGLDFKLLLMTVAAFFHGAE